MVALEIFSELLEVLYSAPLDTPQWARFLTLLTRYTGGRFGVFICADSGRGLSVHAFGGDIDAGSIQLYNERYAQTDPLRLGLIRQNRSGVFAGDDVVPPEIFLQTGLYRFCEGIQPFGVRYVTMVPLTLSVRRFETVSIWRTPDDGPMQPESIALLELLLPHLRQALEIHRVLNVTQQRLSGAEAIADASPTAAFLLTRQGHIVHSNAAAQQLLEQETETLAIHDDVLTTKDARSKWRLQDLVLSTAQIPLSELPAKQKRALALSRSSAKQPLHLIASPLPLERRGGGTAEVLLLVTDPEKPSHFPDQVLRFLFRLTSAETEVANGILMGYTPEEIAELRRSKTSTVRNQIKSILQKTGAARQSDLVRLLMTLPQPPSTA